MSLERFWTNVRSAAGLRSPQVAVDSPRLEPEKIEEMLRGATLWLTPGAIEDYDPDDFHFLSDEERTQLTESVKQFREIANRVPGDAPATEAQIDAALPLFNRMIQILRPDKYADPVALELGKQIEQQVAGKLPEWVREMVFETGSDVNGAPALWIWVVVDDQVTEEQSFHRTFAKIRELLGQATSRVEHDRWPYVRLRTVSEQAEIEPKPSAR